MSLYSSANSLYLFSFEQGQSDGLMLVHWPRNRIIRDRGQNDYSRLKAQKLPANTFEHVPGCAIHVVLRYIHSLLLKKNGGV